MAQPRSQRTVGRRGRAAIEELRERRAEAERLIAKDEEEKQRIVHELQILTERLKRLDEGVHAQRLSTVNVRCHFYWFCFESNLPVLFIGLPANPGFCLLVNACCSCWVRRIPPHPTGLSKKYAARSEYDKAIKETENAFSKILESSKTLLNVIKKESHTLKSKGSSTEG